MKTMKRIKRRMVWLNTERSESMFTRKRFNLFVQKLKLISAYKKKTDYSVLSIETIDQK